MPRRSRHRHRGDDDDDDDYDYDGDDDIPPPPPPPRARLPEDGQNNTSVATSDTDTILWDILSSSTDNSRTYAQFDVSSARASAKSGETLSIVTTKSVDINKEVEMSTEGSPFQAYDYEERVDSKAPARNRDAGKHKGGEKTRKRKGSDEDFIMGFSRMKLCSLGIISAIAVVGGVLGHFIVSQRDSSPSSLGGDHVADLDPDSSDATFLTNNPPTSPTRKPTGFATRKPTGFSTRKPTRFPTDNPMPSPTASIPFNEKKFSTFSFIVMGDIPYSDEEAEILELQFKQLDKTLLDEDLFLVHVGDIMSGSADARSNCNIEDYEAFKRMITKFSPLPALVLPGDNDWTDCTDQDEGWANWEENFISLEWSWVAQQNLTSTGITRRSSNNNDFFIPHIIERQANRQENFSFAHEGVLFIGLNMVSENTSGTEFENRMEDNTEWVLDQLDKRRGELRAVFMFGHAPIEEFFEDIEEELMEDLGEIPVVYIHGNGHKWVTSQPFGDRSPFWKVQVDQGANAPPLRVTLYGEDSPFDIESRENRNDELFDDIIGIDRQGGSSNGPLLSGIGSDILVPVGGDSCTKNKPCGRCEGDCDEDSDCNVGLKCFHRDDTERVTGCTGDRRRDVGWDYCYDPSGV